ncbi:MAG: MBL fold metallo-hydrolase [Spirochaetales bacterium]|nr:MBL fold metallo-hydrolase [Spirochaetales bacterium]
MIQINVLKAGSGDCIIIKDTENKKNILIDGGVAATYEFSNSKRKTEPGPLQEELQKIADAGESLDLVVLTHTDNDHIGGILRWVESPQFINHKDLIKRVWFNSYRTMAAYFNTEEKEKCLIDIQPCVGPETSSAQGNKLENYLETHDIPYQRIIKFGSGWTVGPMKLIVLSPNQQTLLTFFKKWEIENLIPDDETAGKQTDYDQAIAQLIDQDTYTPDASAPNGSSISFFLTYNNKNLLFLGDAYAEVVTESLKALGFSAKKPLKAEYVKLSHHGSTYNTNDELLSLIDCSHYIICTDGCHALPDKACLARIIAMHPRQKTLTFYFNYDTVRQAVFTEDELAEWNIRALEIDEVKL